MRQRSLCKLADGLKNIQIRVDGALIKLLSIHFYQVISSASITDRKSKTPITSTREFPRKVVTNLLTSSVPS